MGRMEHEEQVKDRQGANGATPVIALLAMSSFPYLVFHFVYSLQLSAYRPILHRIIPPCRMPV
jgi:hypothetical protein